MGNCLGRNWNKYMSKTKLKRMITKLDVLIEYHNEQITLVTKIEVEVELSKYYELVEPKVAAHTESRRKSERVLEERTKLLDIITKKILNIDKEKN